MPISFDQVPQVNRIVGAYRPVSTRITLTLIEASFPRAAFIEAARCEVYWNGVLVATVRKDWFVRDEIVSGSWEYQYDVDVQRIAQNYLLPNRGVKSGTFGEMGVKRIGDYPGDATGEIYFDVEFYYRDDDNLLKIVPGGPDTNQVMVCVPFTLPNNKYQLLYGDGLYVYWLGGDVVKCLTNIPSEGVEIDLGDNGWLSYIHHGDFTEVNGYRLRMYDYNGSLLDTKNMNYGLFTGDDLLADEERIVTIGSGVVQLNDATDDEDWEWAFNGVPDGVQITYAVDYYLIDFGYIDPLGLDGNFSARSESVRYNVRKVGEMRAFRVHFMNRFGAADAYTFDCKRMRKVSVSSSKGKKSLDWNMNGGFVAVSGQHNVEDYGGFRFDVESGVLYELESGILSDEKRRWLEELDDTVEAYLEDKDEGVLTRINVEDVGVVPVEDSEDFGVVMKLSVSLSNNVIRQRL